MHAPCHDHLPLQTGAAAIETSLSILLMLLLATAILEFSYWGVVRQLCKLALHESLRIAVAEHGTQEAIDRAFAAVRHSRLTQPWSLRIVQPDKDTLSDFWEPALSAQHGQLVIRNDSQREQHQHRMSRWQDGIGPSSGKTIFQANVIVVELTYQHRLLTPWFRRWLGSAETHVTHQAAMQSDFHAGLTNSHRQPMLDAVGHRSVVFQPLDPPSMNLSENMDQQMVKATKQASNRETDGERHRDRARQGHDHDFKHGHKQNLIPEKTSSRTWKISVREDTLTPLHPDLAEQCGSLMCCMSP